MKRHSFEDDILPELVGKERVYGYITGELVKDIGTPDRYEDINLVINLQSGSL